MQRKIDAVDSLAPHCRIHDRGRERMSHGIASHSVHARGRIDLFDPVGAAQILRGDLAGGGFLVIAHCAKSKHTPRTHAKHPADDALLAHAHPNQRVFTAIFLEELHHEHVVVKGGGSADDFVKIGGDGNHLLQRLFQILGGPIVVMREDESCLAPQTPHLLRFAVRRALQFEIDQLAAGSRCLRQNLQLGGDRTPKLASRRSPPAGGHRDHMSMILGELLDLR